MSGRSPATVATPPAEPEAKAVIDDRPPEPIDPAHLGLVMQGLAAARTGDIATDDEVGTILDRYRL